MSGGSCELDGGEGAPPPRAARGCQEAPERAGAD